MRVLIPARKEVTDMAHDLIPQPFWSFPAPRGLRSFLEDSFGDAFSALPGGMTISEDSDHVYVEAPIPGIDPKKDAVDLTFEQGVLRIVASSKREQEKDRTYFQRSTRHFTYQVAIPGVIDTRTEPTAAVANGILTVTFTKSDHGKPKKIPVQA